MVTASTPYCANAAWGPVVAPAAAFRAMPMAVSTCAPCCTALRGAAGSTVCSHCVADASPSAVVATPCISRCFCAVA